MADNQPQGNPAEPKPEGNPPQLLAGKYKSIEELERGYWESAKAGMKEREARIRAEAQLEALQQARPVAEPRPDPLASALGEASIPIEALDARVEAKALGILQEVLKPMMAHQQAELRLAETHPEFPGAQEIIKGLEPDAAESYRKLLASSPEEAMVLGLAAWKNKPTPGAVDQTSRKVAEAPPKRGGGNVDETGAQDQQRYRELLAEAIQSGNWQNFARYRFGDQPWFKAIAEQKDEY